MHPKIIEQHKETHKRWAKDYARPFDGNQCFLCRFYVELKNPLGMDWGVCSNPKSVFDGELRFEHNGCDDFVLMPDDPH